MTVVDSEFYRIRLAPVRRGIVAGPPRNMSRSQSPRNRQPLGFQSGSSQVERHGPSRSSRFHQSWRPSRRRFPLKCFVFCGLPVQELPKAGLLPKGGSPERMNGSTELGRMADDRSSGGEAGHAPVGALHYGKRSEE